MHVFDHSQDGEVGWWKYDGTILKSGGDHFEDDLLQGSVVEDVPYHLQSFMKPLKFSKQADLQKERFHKRCYIMNWHMHIELLC